MNNASNFQYVLCPGSLPQPEFQDTYNKIYNCWESVWKSAFNELGVNKPFYSDAFTRQDYVGALFHKGNCFALSFFRWMDANSKEFANDSYFYNWQPEHLQKLCSRGNKIIICCYFTVHPYGRGSNLGLSGKDLLTGISIETFLNSNADAMTGAVRINKGVNKSTERWSSYLIEGDVPSGYGDANVDLVGFFKDHIQSMPQHELKPLVKSIWESRIVIPRLNVNIAFNREQSEQIRSAA